MNNYLISMNNISKLLTKFIKQFRYPFIEAKGAWLLNSNQLRLSNV